MKKFVCVIVENPNLKKQTDSFIGVEPGVELAYFKGMDDFYTWSKGKQVHALVCEIKLTIKGQWESRKILNLLDKAITVARVRWDSASNEIIGIIDNESFVDGNFWEHFLSLIKENNHGRLIRKEERREKFWNIEVLTSLPGVNDHLFNTRDISPGGLFIICAHPPAMGIELELKIAEVEDQTPIKAVIRWIQKWGNKNNFPAGFGVEFIQITDLQKEQINEKLGYRIQYSTIEEIENLVISKNQK